MKNKRHIFLFIVLLGTVFCSMAQDISLYQQFNGRYDFLFFGNTLNPVENNIQTTCEINTSSSATLNLASGNIIEKAYLYWAGSGTGDFDIKLNDVTITPDRTFSTIQSLSGLPFFGGFKDVTEQVITTGNGIYTVSDFDLNDVIADYCPNATNFAGWGILLVYRNDTLPLNQINIYDGFESLSIAFFGDIAELNIILENLNVIDNVGSKIGFLAWEGDKNLQVEERLRLNGNILVNLPLNPANNAFNGTNSFNGQSNVYNMDMDVYSTQNMINIGDTTAEIKMTTGQDYVIINTFVTKFNNQLPDATAQIVDVLKECDSRTITVNFEISNPNSTEILPSGVPVSVYINNDFIEYTETTLPITINGVWQSQITLTVPESYGDTFTLKIVADDHGDGTGIVTELNDNNNVSNIFEVTLYKSPLFNSLEPLEVCNEGYTAGTFNFSNYNEMVKVEETDIVHFFETQTDAENNSNPILNTTNYLATTTPKEIFIRIDNQNCYSITSFLLTTRNCLPTVYNYVSANNDGYNDEFFIDGLLTIFLNFKIEIYNRWGRLIWTGNADSGFWKGQVPNGIGTEKAPDGTYYYLIFLNDKDHPEPLKGYLYLNH